jgi:hypothetical protein
VIKPPSSTRWVPRVGCASGTIDEFVGLPTPLPKDMYGDRPFGSPTSGGASRPGIEPGAIAWSVECSQPEGITRGQEVPASRDFDVSMLGIPRTVLGRVDIEMRR